MSNLRDELEEFFKGEMVQKKKKRTFEQVFQETLDKTTPAQPGDIRNTRKWEDAPKDELDEWA